MMVERTLDDFPCGAMVAFTDFGSLPTGEPVVQYRLTNNNGLEIILSNYGASIISILAPDREGNFADIVLGYNNVLGYYQDDDHMGSVVGPYAGRISQGCFVLGEKKYQLQCNAGSHHLHGGEASFNKKLWRANTFQDQECVGVKFSCKCADGEGGYPGEREVVVAYSLDNENNLQVTYKAETSKDTIFNLTQHSYFNLSGLADSSIEGHILKLQADSFLPVDESLIPLGELQAVADTPMDFRSAKAIGLHIDAEDKQIGYGKGYDHTWVLSSQCDNLAEFAARVVEPVSGRTLTVLTDQPGLQFYTANNLEPEHLGKKGARYTSRQGFCLETQNFPDAPNNNNFPSATLSKGNVYRTKTIFQFGVMN